MAYLAVEDFKLGLDRRRPRKAGVPGTLWLLVNGHISRGGDIERRKEFVPFYALPPGTFGMASVYTQLFVFGSLDLAGAMPIGVQYQRCEATGANMVEVLDVQTFDGKFYVIAEFDDGNVYHFYDGARVADWDVIADANTNFAALAGLLAEKVSADDAVQVASAGQTITLQARVPGVPFTVSGSAVDRGSTDDQTVTITTVQPNVSEVPEVRASAAIEIIDGVNDTDNAVTSVTVDGVELLSEPVPWTATREATAIRLQQVITSAAAQTGYDATVAGAVVTIHAAPGTGAAPNGLPVAVTHGTNIQLSHDPVLGGGVTHVDPVRQVVTATLGGTFEPVDMFSLTVNGVEYRATGRAAGTGRTCWVFKQRLWSTSRSLLRYCMLNNPSVWDPANTTEDNDAGFINLANQNEGQDNLVCVAEYNGRAAIFSRNSIRIWELAVDPAQNSFVHTLENSGTMAPHSVVSYGNNDVFYLNDTGLRSVRARAATDNAAVADVGNAIDPYVRQWLDAVSSDTARRAVAVIEPIDGRYWLAVGERIFVLSYFPGGGQNNISAWSVYEPGFVVSDFTRIHNQLYARSGDTIYLYGGLNGDTYPDEGQGVVQAWLPFLSARNLGQIKGIIGFDIACEGLWEVEVCINPNDERQVILAGQLEGSTYSEPNIALNGRAAVFAPKFECRSAGPATLSSFALYFKNAEPAK
ncbi:MULTISPECIES: hypothetical protein [Chelatococcus]|uniref:Ubiquitin-activating enzyme E1 FCCH domain-containing protein n=1 Tax=Chelatococcus caeni TaxID=1348468 RepID=A0A840BX89_9HYPH|nr:MULTISPECIES: hypothetical protein [Chelatococcus]ALA16079.1 hypothetical protein AL346_00065 [Chelatococcus sp. CO-6]MBB4017580.1 hypothetical protein [Chelatococcus caeni]